MEVSRAARGRWWEQRGIFKLDVHWCRPRAIHNRMRGAAKGVLTPQLADSTARDFCALQGKCTGVYRRARAARERLACCWHCLRHWPCFPALLCEDLTRARYGRRAPNRMRQLCHARRPGRERWHARRLRGCRRRRATRRAPRRSASRFAHNDGLCRRGTRRSHSTGCDRAQHLHRRVEWARAAQGGVWVLMERGQGRRAPTSTRRALGGGRARGRRRSVSRGQGASLTTPVG